MTGIHRYCYWQYFYGDEHEVCPACRQQLLDAEELFCFGAYTSMEIANWSMLVVVPGISCFRSG